MVAELITAIALILLYPTINQYTKGTLKQYLIAPICLFWVHAIGSQLQESAIGPEWMQYHLHVLGVPAACTPLIMMSLVGIIGWKSSKQRQPLNASWGIDFTLRWTPTTSMALTVVCLVQEIAQVTVYRETYMARGYSGDLDIGDLLALFAGASIMVINHFALRGSVRRKREELLKRLSSLFFRVRPVVRPLVGLSDFNQ